MSNIKCQILVLILFQMLMFLLMGHSGLGDSGEDPGSGYYREARPSQTAGSTSVLVVLLHAPLKLLTQCHPNVC